jgi:sterol O-acyltransferase
MIILMIRLCSQWPWVQSGFLTLHALVMIMKMHSYMATNGYLSQVALQIKRIKKQMHQLAEQMPGGWDAALAMSQARRAELDALTDASDTETTASAISPSPSMSNGRLNVPHAGFNARTSVPTTPSLEAPTDGTSRSYIDANSAATLRQRLVSAAEEPTFARQEDRYRSKKDDDASIDPTPPLPNGNMPGMQGINFTRDPTELERGAPGVHPLVDHPDDLLSALARELSELEGELVSSGPQYVHWPANISAQNFAVYQLIPTLVYELEYPRTDRIRPLYIFEKTVATFGSFALLYTITESFIIPLTPTPDQSFFRSLLDLALPFMVSYLLLFYLIFGTSCIISIGKSKS